MASNFVAFVWGLAEATIFFILPDVALSIIALMGIDAGLEACLFALLGALIGGTIMFYTGKANLQKAIKILRMIPAIPDKDIEKVHSDILNSGIKAILFGPVFGIPYKIYAVYAHLNTTIINFLLISIPARIIRFIIVVFFTHYMINKYLSNATYMFQVQSITFVWILIYIVYFVVKRK